MNTENMNAAELKQFAADLNAKAVEMRKAERRKVWLERREKEAKEKAEHYARMFSEIGKPFAGLNEKQHGMVYAMAWEQGRGHSSGYSQVESYYGEFAEFARKIIESN